ncbi:MAG: hypothetical protein J7K89_04940, partial [Candidatus Cloacimonetes bacterium]|nr:hypothetical protein [Candidatus Cloacimonadota bacterium]
MAEMNEFILAKINSESIKKTNSMKYKIKFINSQFGKTQLNDYIANCNHLSNIYDLFNQNLISIEKLEPPFGDLRSEHLM